MADCPNLGLLNRIHWLLEGSLDSRPTSTLRGNLDLVLVLVAMMVVEDEVQVRVAEKVLGHTIHTYRKTPLVN
jgi:hypothetical protein